MRLSPSLWLSRSSSWDLCLSHRGWGARCTLWRYSSTLLAPCHYASIPCGDTLMNRKSMEKLGRYAQDVEAGTHSSPERPDCVKQSRRETQGKRS